MLPVHLTGNTGTRKNAFVVCHTYSCTKTQQGDVIMQMNDTKHTEKLPLHCKSLGAALLD